MLIPEAAGLILQAGAMGDGGTTHPKVMKLIGNEKMAREWGPG